MLIPIKPLDIELAPEAPSEVPVASRYRRVRVLARWSGIPVAVVETSVVDGHVRRCDVLAAILKHRPAALSTEAVRRALINTGVDTAMHPGSLTAPAPANAYAGGPSFSVAVCTRDRPQDLRLCLEALEKCVPAPLEVLVVDNAPSTEATAALLSSRFPRFRYIREDEPGLDNARNRAIHESSADIIAFTDDDVIVDPSWIGALAECFIDPAVGLVTGLIEPFELETRAQVLFEQYGGFGRGCRRAYLQGPRHGRIRWSLVGAGQLGAGANMALRRNIFNKIGGFDPVLDVGTPTLGGGDHEMFYRVLRAGYLCVYEPSAVVRHRHRRTVTELRRLLFAYGHATRCYLDRVAINFPGDRSSVRRLRLWWWRHWAVGRWWRSSFRPPLLPVGLVMAEIRGYVRARGAYARIRSTLITDESKRPDAFASSPSSGRSKRETIGIAVVDTAYPLRSIPAATAFDQMRICVEWRGRRIGEITISNHGGLISAIRLADEISSRFSRTLLTPLELEQKKQPFKLPASLLAHFSAGAPGLPPPGDEPVSIVVTTCDRPDALRRCLQSLMLIRTRRSLQIIVVNNRPGSPAASVVREIKGIECVDESRRGSSYARNAGIAAARHEFVAMVDDDMTVSAEWLENLLAPFAHADVMAVTGNTLPGRLETHAERMLELYGGFGRGPLSRTFDQAWFHKNRHRAVPTWKIGGSGNAAFRTAIFKWSAIGKWDPRLGAGVPTGVGEDTKLFYDILHAGYSIVYEPTAVARHFHRVTTAGLTKQLYAYSKGHVAYHLITFLQHRDCRALVRIGIELPLAFLERSREKLFGRYPYPWTLLGIELAGTLAAPWSLWRATRQARRVEQHHRRTQDESLRSLPPVETAEPPAIEVHP